MPLHRPLLVTAYLLISIMVSSNGADTLMFSPDYKFRDGVFLSFDQVKANAAIPKFRLITSEPYNSRTFFDEIVKGKDISFYDEFGAKKPSL